ncbi:hypothetical protein T03_9846 [Trichinella britovi]|uniref:Uncharacterized protein n=1 Tax=Trichinella britovi TaxID=45882 RepID=A0A0V0Z2C3_TRIBR|nr:hypothetical protein T03_9846 [Trichinella britovi]
MGAFKQFPPIRHCWPTNCVLHAELRLHNFECHDWKLWSGICKHTLSFFNNLRESNTAREGGGFAGY